MFTQPSVNQIASTYQGNPAPLARKVDQDKKQNNGIPQDLRQLLALNDITQGRNAMGIQQALQIPTNMPTVAQDLQERARQALQARQMQAMQEMQRKNGQPNMVPPGTPRPPMQSQGLDSLETNVGEGYAEGGIIGFDGTKTSSVQDPTIKEEEATSQGGDILRAIANAISGGVRRTTEYGKLKSEREEARPGFFEALTPTQRAERLKRTDTLSEQMAQVADKGEIKPTYPQGGKAIPGTYDRPIGEDDFAREVGTMLRRTPAAVEAEAKAPPAPAKKVNTNPQAQNRVNAPEAPGIAAALPPEQSAAYKKLSTMMNLDPDAQERLAQEKFKQQVGSRDLSIYDKTAAELEARKQKLNAPKAGYDAMMEYLEQIAMGGGRTAAESGSMGASRQRALQKERLSQQDLLMDKILELGGKKSEAEYAQKEKMYQVGQERYKEVFKNAFDAAKSVNSSDDEAKRIAAQAVENEKNRQNQLRTAQIGAQDRDNLMSRARALMAADPTKKMTLEQAMQRAGELGAAGQMESADVKRLAAYNAKTAKLAEQFPEWSMRDTPEGRKVRARYEKELAQARIDAGLTASGINALPTSTGLPAGVTVTQVK
jgi:hypothetical protein